MPHFAYTGRDAAGNRVSGKLEAENVGAVADRLVQTGVIPVDIVPARAKSGISMDVFKPRIAPQDIMFFSRQMYTLMKAGVPILQGLAGLRDSVVNRSFKSALNLIRDKLDSGLELNLAMRETGIFNNFYLNMVRVGETTGRLEEIFLRLFQHIEFEERMRANIKRALRYPSFVLMAIVAAMFVINLFVIPQFAKVFNQMHAQLPLMTRILIGVSGFTVHYWWVLLAGLVLAALACKFWLETRQGRYLWDRALLFLPVVGPIVRKATLGRFARALSLSLKSGVPIVQALTSVALVVDNAYVAEKIEGMCRGVGRGESVLRTASQSGVFMPLVLQMIAVGEETGALDELLLEIAQMYERDVEYAIENLGASIEPIMLILIGGMVLVLALGVFLPLWDLGGTMLHHH